MFFAKEPPSKPVAFCLYVVFGLLLLLAALCLFAGIVNQMTLQGIQTSSLILAIAVAIFPPLNFSIWVKVSAGAAFFVCIR
jgi:hypothetical protein